MRLISDIDGKCLKNKHTEELIGKPYFTEWLRLKTKVNFPLIIIWFAIQFLNIALFSAYDGIFLWVETSLALITLDNCTVSERNFSCNQKFYGISNIHCSSWLVYLVMIFLIVINSINILNSMKLFYLGLTKFQYLAKKPVPMKERLVHTATYAIMQLTANLSIIVNVVVRAVRYYTEVYIPPYIDNLTYYFACFGWMWGVLFLIQLVPYIGSSAIVMKLMMNDALIYLCFIAVCCVPYSQLFIRIANYRTPNCDPNWDSLQISSYNTLLLLFNMLSLKPSTDDDTDSLKTMQLYVSIICFVGIYPFMGHV